MADKDVCYCIENLRRLISDSSNAIRFGIHHDFPKAREYVKSALDTLKELESCAGVDLWDTRDQLETADRNLAEFKDALAEENLKLAQWRIFREIRDRVCETRPRRT